MGKNIKSLAKDTAIYGVSSIVGKFLNWLLVPLYTYKLANTAEYGVVTNLYAWTALLLVVLTYGMETGFFRFANKEGENAEKVYGNSLISLGLTSLVFSLFIIIFHYSIGNFLGYGTHPEYIWMLGLTVAMDAFASIPFAYLRYTNRPIRFAALKLLYIGLNIVLNLFFLIGCPWLMKVAPESITWFYNPSYGVGYIFISNLIATTIQTLVLSKYIFQANFELDKVLLKKILHYSLPLLILGIAGTANQLLDKIIFPFMGLGEETLSELGVYGAVGKIAMVIMMFTQAFRYAYEPFVFAKNKDKNSLQSYADAMKYFVIFSLLIFIGIIFYLDLIKYLISSDYWDGLPVVPVIMFSYIFQGVYFNLSIWYKLTDKNHYGAWFSTIGMVIIIVGNILFVPTYSYWGAVWSAFAGYFVIVLLSYFFGQKHMPVHYDLKSIALYTITSFVLLGIAYFINTPYLIINLFLKTLLLVVYLVVLIKRDLPLRELPILNKWLKKIE